MHVVSRCIAKNFLRDIKGNAFHCLRDVGYFGDQFKQTVLLEDVLPFLMEQTELMLANNGSSNSYPTSLIANHIQTREQVHESKVKEYHDMIKARRAAEKQAAEDKVKAKMERRARRAAEAKAA